mgnify:CR=1 FL=1
MEEKNTNVPVLALRGLTIFPNMLMHFDVERDISVKALEAAMELSPALPGAVSILLSLLKKRRIILI